MVSGEPAAGGIQRNDKRKVSEEGKHQNVAFHDR